MGWVKMKRGKSQNPGNVQDTSQEEQMVAEVALGKLSL